MGVAKELDCTAVALCSRPADAAGAAKVAAALGARLTAIDVPSHRSVLPSFSTSELLAGTAFESPYDLSEKRNLGLLIARLSGWQQIVFLDDDVSVPSPNDLVEAASWLSDYQAVGLANVGWPDNSVVCHVYREVDPESQAQFIGAGALAVNPQRSASFFPDIYCEDWFYFLGEANPPSLAVTGTVSQREFDPFTSVDRAKNEELGDSLAEGMYWLLDERDSAKLDEVSHWRDFLRRRREFIQHLLKEIIRSEYTEIGRRRRVEALEAALRRNSMINPSLCVEYLRRWQADVVLWQQFLAEVDAARTDSIDEALDWLGLADVSYRT